MATYMNNEGKTILKTFIESGLHPNGDKEVIWPKHTTVVCLIDYSDNSDNIFITKNLPLEKHAEEILIDSIDSEQDETRIRCITIYSNYSSCTECSHKLQTLKGKYPELRIKFSSLYNIKRPSCAESACKCNVDDPEAFRMLMGLGALPFQKEDWADLITLLRRKYEQTPGLDEIRYGDYYGDWRDKEDKKMKADYQNLSQGQ